MVDEKRLKRNVERRKAGLCVCGKEQAPGLLSCKVCLEKRKQNASKLRKKRKAEGKCIRCGTPHKGEFKNCDVCRDKSRSASLTSRMKRKQLIFNHYGNKCACCGEAEPVFLTIDHINDDGAEHRREIGGGRGKMGGDAIVHWLIRNDFPPGFQILCWNCNLAKHIYGKCPHQG